MATTSAAATASSASSQRVRQAWRLFEQWQAPKRTEMQRQCNLSSTTPAKRREIEHKHYLTARGEWQRRLTSAGLKDEDWGTMTAAEKKAVELALGGERTSSSTTTGITADDVDNSMSLVPHASASNSAATSNPSLLQPPPQIGSSFSTSSINSSVSSYEFVSPSELVSDDDGDDDDDDGAQGFMFQVAVTTAEHDIRHQARRSASVSEDEALPPTSFNYGPPAISASNSHYGYGLSSPTSTTNQWRPFDTPSYQHWSNSEASSRHPSANASPAQPPPKAFYTPVMSTIHPLTASSSTSSSSSSKPMPVTTSSSGWAASALASVATSAYAAVSSSTFGSSPPEAGTAQASKPKASSASKAPSSSASASASASALVPVSTFSSSGNRGSSHSKSVSASNAAATSASSASASSMAIVPRQASPAYIGPILSDSGEDDHDESMSDPYDPDDAEFEFKKFKTHTRIQKIIEFHREAAELEVRLVVEIERMRASVDHLPRDAEKKLIEGHQAQMRALQQSKELERKRIVKEERKRRRHALTAASASSSTSSLSLALVPQWNPNQPHPHPSRSEKFRNTDWLDAYDHAGSDLEVTMPGGFEFEHEPAASYNPHHQSSSSSSSPYPYDQVQTQFGHPYPDLPTPQGPYSGDSFQQQQQHHNGQHWSPPTQTFSPHSSSASSSNNASPSSFWDTAPLHPGTTPSINGGANPNGRNSAGIQHNSLLRRPPTVNGRRPPSLSPQIARPRPMPAWNPQQLEYSAEEDNGGPEHYESRQDYDWAQEPGYGHGQGQARGYSPHDSSMEEQWGGAHSRHQTQQPQQQQVFQQPPAPAYETFQMSSNSFNDDDAYGGAQGASDFFGGGEMDIPITDELRAAMGGYNYGQGHGEYSPSSREEREMKAREEAVWREQQEIQARQQEQEQQRPARKGMPINTSRKNSDFGREDKKGTPASLKGGAGGDALNSSTNTLHGGVMNKTPTTTSPLASFIPSKLNGLGFGSLWGGKGAEQPVNKQVKEEEEEGLSEEEEEEDGEEEEEEESARGWFSSQPQKKQAPPPPVKKVVPPPPAPAPAPTTAKGRRAAAKAQALAEAKAKAEAEEQEKAAKAAEEAEASRRAAEAAKEKEAKSAPAVPEKTTAGGKKQTKKQKAAGKKGGNGAKSEPAPAPAPAPTPPPVEETKKTWAPPASVKESKQAAEPVKKGTSSLSSSVLSNGSEGSWGEASSTPRPSPASIKAQAGWGDRPQQQQDVLGASGVLRKQAVMHQAQHKQETNGAGGPMPTIDTSPLPDDLRASLWSRATSRPVATPVSATTPTATSTPTASNSGWKVSGSKARRGSDGAANPFESSAPKNGSSKVANGGPLPRKARNGLSSAPKKVTIEEVSDEEADMSADGSLGLESRYLLESAEEAERQQEIAHPRPSMPPSSYNNFFGNDHYDEGFTSSANSSYAPQTPSTAPTSPPDDIPPMSNEELFSSATKNIKLQKALNGQGGGHSKSASGFASDWDATVKQKRPRWSTTTSGMRPASSATVGPGAAGPAQSAFRYKSSLAPPPMTAPMSSSESDDLTSPIGAIPGGFPPPARGNVAGSGAAGGNASLMNAREQMRAAAAAGGGRTIPSSSNGPSTFGAGGRQAVETNSADSALLERFMQAQRQEEMKRAMAR